ncbi:hypothetical protein AB0E83_32745 [Streptomyces sp. NPDC035033]|uniref:hypothetical protein n=1 Tax=Streptomyces sp. NPDC035033 TaxID=3155368 RepID=UPI0033DC072F
MEDRELILRVRENPGGYGLGSAYHPVAMFLAGYDLARSGGMLRGFHEWLCVRGGELSAQHWIRRIPSEAVPDLRFQGFERFTAEQDRRSVEHLLSSVLGFLAVRDDRRALPKMYAAYDSLLDSVYGEADGPA